MKRIIMGPADRPFITALRNRALIGLTAAQFKTMPSSVTAAMVA